MNATVVEARPRATALALLLFPLAVWAVATLFLGGDLGRMSDDYAMLRRDPVTGALRLPATYTNERPFFVRPAYFLVTHNLVTLAYGHEWIVHVLMAFMHGSVALLLYAVLRRAGVGALAASAAAVLWLVVPQCHESVYWMSAMGYEESLVAFLVLALLVLHRAVRGIAFLGLVFLLALNVPCWNEQAAAALPALPFLCLAARPADRPFGRVARGAALVTGTCLVALVLYAAFLVGTAPSGVRGSASSLISADELWPRTRAVASQAWDWSLGRVGRDLAAGGLIRAAEELRSARGVVALGLLGLTGAAFIARWTSARPPAAGPAPARDACRLGWLALFGACVTALAFVPIAVIREQPLESRLCSVPAAGLAIVAASGVEALLWVTGRRGAHRTAGALGMAIAAGAAVFALAAVGFQARYRDGSRLDRSVPEQLATLVPNPEPGTVFVVLHARARVARTGRPSFDWALFAWIQHYAIRPLTREVFARDDIEIVLMNPPVGRALTKITPESFVVPYPLDVDGTELDQQGVRVRWARTVPFVIDEECRVTLARRLWIERADGRDLRVPETRVPRGAQTASSLVVPSQPTGSDRALVGWRREAWAATSPKVPVARRSAFGLAREVLASGPAGLPGRVALELEAFPTHSALVFRVAAAGGLPSAGTVRLRCSWESERERPLAQLDLGFAELAAEERWTPFLVELGPLAAARPICLEMSCEPASGNLMVTPGLRVLRAAGQRR